MPLDVLPYAIGISLFSKPYTITSEYLDTFDYDINIIVILNVVMEKSSSTVDCYNFQWTKQIIA